MPNSKIRLIDRIKLGLFGKRHYQAKILHLFVLKRYGFERYYSNSQVRFSAEALGFKLYFDEKVAVALLCKPEDSDSIEAYQGIRQDFGFQNGGALEVLRVYGKAEKVDSDPFGSHRASEATGGIT